MQHFVQLGIQDFPLGGALTHWVGGTDLQCGCFLAEMHVKMKELGPVGEGAHTESNNNCTLHTVELVSFHQTRPRLEHSLCTDHLDHQN